MFELWSGLENVDANQGVKERGYKLRKRKRETDRVHGVVINLMES